MLTDLKKPQNHKTTKPQNNGWVWLVEWSFLRYPIGILLLTAAFLKWQAFGGPYSSPVFDMAPQLEWLVIQVELLLGVILLLGWVPRFSWYATIGIFSTFAGASLMMIWQGRSSCGCLGAVEVNPGLILAGDLILIALLFLVVHHPDSDDSNRPSLTVNRMGRGGLLCSLVGLLLGLIIVWRGAEIGAVLARAVPPSISGQYLMSEPPIVDLGTGNMGSWRSVTVAVRNRSFESITLIGAERNCRCQADASLPITIAPGESIEINVEVRMGQNVGVQRDRFWLRTNHQRQPLLLCRWQARVIESAKSQHATGEQSIGWKMVKCTVSRHSVRGFGLLALSVLP